MTGGHIEIEDGQIKIFLNGTQARELVSNINEMLKNNPLKSDNEFYVITLQKDGIEGPGEQTVKPTIH